MKLTDSSNNFYLQNIINDIEILHQDMSQFLISIGGNVSSYGSFEELAATKQLIWPLMILKNKPALNDEVYNLYVKNLGDFLWLLLAGQHPYDKTNRKKYFLEGHIEKI